MTATEVHEVTEQDSHTLVAAYDDACNLASAMYDASMDTSDIDASVDALLAEMIRRNLI